jgi:hypothetical protein
MYCGFAAVKNYVINKGTREYSSYVHFSIPVMNPMSLGFQ